jgi:hypothetical protein
MTARRSLVQHSNTGFSPVGPPWWDARPVAIVGNGPSLRGFDYLRLRGFHVLAVKGQMFNIAFADAGFGLDIPRYVEWCGMLGTLSMPVYWATPNMRLLGEGPHAPCVRFLRRIDLTDLSDDPAAIFSGGSSGFGALGLAWLKRARRIVLLGFEYNGDYGEHADTRAYIHQREQKEWQWRLTSTVTRKCRACRSWNVTSARRRTYPSTRLFRW